jgi:hypothetical protein
MGSRLINVRLDPDRLRKAQRLRARGVALSTLVREAIDQRYGELDRPAARDDAATIVESILAEYPDPPGLPGRSYDVHDRRATRRAILRKLGRRRS